MEHVRWVPCAVCTKTVGLEFASGVCAPRRHAKMGSVTATKCVWMVGLSVGNPALAPPSAPPHPTAHRVFVTWRLECVRTWLRVETGAWMLGWRRTWTVAQAVDLPALLVLTALPHRIAVVASCAGVGFASLPTVSMVSGHRVWMRQMWTVVRSPVGAPCAELVVYAACTASVRLAPVLRRVCVGRHLLARLAHVAGYAPHAVLVDHAALVQTASQTCA